jgi:hypothetical protein
MLLTRNMPIPPNITSLIHVIQIRPPGANSLSALGELASFSAWKRRNSIVKRLLSAIDHRQWHLRGYCRRAAFKLLAFRTAGLRRTAALRDGRDWNADGWQFLNANAWQVSSAQGARLKREGGG